MLNNIQNSDWCRCRKQLETDSKHDMSFHIQNILSGVSMLTEGLEVADLRDLIGLLVFGGDPEGSDANKLQFISRNLYVS